MANKVDNAIDRASNTLKGKPIISGAGALAGGLATLNFMATQDYSGAAIITTLASPFVTAGLTASAGLNLFRDRSKLSKVFSAAAAASGLISIGAAIAQSSAPGWDGALGFFYTTIGMTAAGLFNVAAHYTKNTHVTLSTAAPGEPQEKGPGPQPPAPPQ